MANIFTNLNLTADSNFFITQKINSIGYVGENTVTRLNIKVPEITDGATYELETENSAGEKNVALLSTDAENNTLYLDFTANMLTVNDLIMMQLRVTYTDNSIKKSNRFAMKIAKSISATDYYEEYAVTIFDQLVQDCRDIIEGAESYAIRAETAAVNAEAYSESASASAEAASASEVTATSASVTAVNAKTSAESASAAAHTSAETATTAANSASASASTAQTSAQTAQSASEAATTASETAVNASTVATTAANSAENSATSASTAANNASASATSAATSASNASNSATSATTAASNAATSETNAATSAASASTSAANANTSATNAANSATSAATSATNAHNSEVNASTSETNAGASAVEAAASAESIAASVAQINENTYRINDLEAIIAGYQQADLPTGAVASVTDGTALLMPSLKVGIEPVQSGSGDPSPENIRPISGWTAANVIRAGKNILRLPTYEEVITYPKTNNGYYNIPIKAIPNATYYLSTSYLNEYSPIGTGMYVLISEDKYNTKFKAIAHSAYGKNDGILTVNTEGYLYLNVVCSASAWNTLCNNVQTQLELGDTATIYKPYDASTTYTIEFRDGDNPLTVYGGTLDVTNGELVVDRASADLGSLTWGYSSADVRFYSNSLVYNKQNPNAICSHYQSVTLGELVNGTICVYNNGYIYVKDSHYTSASDFKTAMNGVQLVYKLTTPTTVHLTPTQVRTLVGNNNIWADTGDIIEGKYFRSLV